MAKIFGVEVKAVKNHRDHEGCTIHSGNIYVDGKKIGSWEDSYMSGPPDYDIPDGPVWVDLVARADRFYDTMKADSSAYKGDPDVLIYELIRLNEREKDFKACLKKGYQSMVIISGAYGQFSCLYIPVQEVSGQCSTGAYPSGIRQAVPYEVCPGNRRLRH